MPFDIIALRYAVLAADMLSFARAAVQERVKQATLSKRIAGARGFMFAYTDQLQANRFANQTFFITDDVAHASLRFAHSLKPVMEIAVFSDGLERVLLNIAEHRAHTPAFDKMLSPLRGVEGCGHIAPLSDALARYLATPAVTSRADDDVTLVIAGRWDLQSR